jgi:tetratricopeptide (TPR) repeat protein
LPDIAQLNIQYNLAQLYAQQENYAMSLELLEVWLLVAKNVTPQVHVFMANMYVQQKLYPKAIQQLQSAIQKEIEKTGQPKQVWFQQLIALHFEQQQFEKMIDILKITIQRFPMEKKYWQQLAGIYQKLDEMESALAILVIANQQGLLDTEKDLLNLANFYLYQNLPYQSASILRSGFERGIIDVNEKNWSRLVESWIVAKESDLAIQSLYLAMQKEMLVEKFILRLARLLIENEEWDEVISVLEVGMQKITFAKESDAYYLLGIAGYYAGKLKLAKKAFRVANKDKKMQKKLKFWRKLVRF